MIVPIDMLIHSKDVYSLQKFDVGKNRQKSHVTLKPNVELKRQRASKVPLHSKDKLENLLTQLKDTDIVREMGDDDEMGSLFGNPIVLMPKSNYVKLLIDARYLKSITDLTNYSWPLEPLQMIITRVNGKFFSVSDLSCAYHQVPLVSKHRNLQASSSVDDNILSPEDSTAYVAYPPSLAPNDDSSCFTDQEKKQTKT